MKKVFKGRKKKYFSVNSKNNEEDEEDLMDFVTSPLPKRHQDFHMDNLLRESKENINDGKKEADSIKVESNAQNENTTTRSTIPASSYPLPSSKSKLKRRRDAFGNILPSEKEVPRIAFAIIGLLILFNIVAFGIKLIFSIRKHQSLLVIYGVTLDKWLILIDSAIFGMVFFWVLLRGIMIALEKLAHRSQFIQYAYFFCYPYETPLYIITSAIFLLILYPILLEGLVSSAKEAEEAVWYALISILEISIAYGAKTIFINILEGYVYNDLRKDIVATAYHEAWLSDLERPLSEDGGPTPEALLSARFARKGLKHFFSGGLNKIKVNVDDHVPLSEASRNLAQRLIDKYTDDRGYLTLDDFRSFIDSSDADHAFKLFDMNGDDKVSVTDLTEAIIQIFKKRKVVLNKMKSRRLNIDVAEILLTFVLVVLSFLLILFNFSVDLSSMLIAATTVLLGLSFAYSKTVQELFDSLYMLYMVKPFDIGDNIRINDGPTLIVEQVGVLTTCFRSVDGYDVFVRNSALTQSKLSNLNRGEKLVIEVKFVIDKNTSVEQLAALNRRIQDYLNRSRLWSANFNLAALNEDNDRLASFIDMSLRVHLKYGIKWQQRGVWTAAKTALILQVQKFLQEIKIQVTTFPTTVSVVGGWPPTSTQVEDL